jgi:hypothetical protein
MIASAVSLAAIIWAIVSGHIVAFIIFVVVGALIALLARNMHKAHTVKAAKIKAAVGRTNWPERLGPWLLDGEKAEWEGRKHPIAILGWWTLAIGGPILGIIAGIAGSNVVIFLILLIMPPLIASWFIIDWWYEWRAITNARAVEVKGIFNTRIPAAPLSAILTAEAVEPFLSKALTAVGLPGYIHVVFETAADVESIPGIKYVREPIKMMAFLQSRFMPKNPSNTP